MDNLEAWWKRLGEARELGHFTPEDRVDAGTWATCAVGWRPEPHSVLEAWGIAFEWAVKHDDPAQAEFALVEIGYAMGKVDPDEEEG